MKNNKAKNNTANGNGTKPVHVEFNDSTAKKISIAGTFNDWRPEATPMIPFGQGRWVKELALAPGVYEYRLVVDGKWMPDPNCTEFVSNPYNERNSLLRVKAQS